MTVINLIPMQIQHAKARRRRIRAWAMIAIGWCSTLAIAYAGFYLKFAYPVHSLDAELNQAATNIDEIEHNLATTRAQIQELSQKLDSNRRAVIHPDWSILLALLSDSLGDDIVLGTASVSRGEEAIAIPVQKTAAAPAPPTPIAKVAIKPPAAPTWTLSIQGLGRTPTAVSQFVLRLESTGLFDHVDPQKITREPFRNAEATAFRIECQMKSKGRAGK
jgi:hypothetical protein